MTRDEWDDKYEPINNKDGSIIFNEDDDADAINEASKKGTLWTLVDTDEGCVIIPGFHYVNRVHYHITKLPDDGSVDEIKAN